nr:lipoyltransferase 1, mitochondrial-like [Onthophagus taurus]
MVKNAILKRFGLEIIVSDRDDLIYGDYKVSGTAARYTRTTSYHHCTLLVNADKNILSKSLQKPSYFIKTNASQSTRSPIKNLNELNQKITIPELIQPISKEYLTTLPYLKDNFDINLISNHNIHHVNPTEEDYPELLDFRDEMKSSEWIFGSCPDFTATKLINLDESTEIKVNFNVVKGIVTDVDVENNFNRKLYLELFKDRKFDENLFEEIKDCLNKELNQSVVHKSINN